MTLEEFVQTLNEEQLRFLVKHFYVSMADDDAGMLRDYQCQRGQLKEAVRDLLDRDFGGEYKDGD